MTVGSSRPGWSLTAASLAAILAAAVSVPQATAAAFSGDGQTRSLMRAESTKPQVHDDMEEAVEDPPEVLTEEEIAEMHNSSLMEIRILHESEEAEKAGYTMSTGLHYRRRRVLRPGMVVALHNHIHRRYIRAHSWKLDSSAPVGNRMWLPDTWTWERWTVVSANRRRGAIALHSKVWNRFMKMSGHRMMMSPPRNDWQLPWNWQAERFLPYEFGGGYIGLWHPTFRRWVSMRGHWMGTIYRGWGRLPNGYTWERFTIIENNQLLVPGTIVALHCRIHNRFLRMHGHYTDSSAPRAWNQLPAGWTWERFTVIDVGHGEVALYNKIHKRFVKLGGASGIRTHLSLPRGWTWERFSVVNAGNGEIGLHNAAHNRYLRMHGHRIDYSAKRSATSFPWGWTWERFRVVKVGTDPLVMTELGKQEMAELLSKQANEEQLNDDSEEDQNKTAVVDDLPEPEEAPYYAATPPETTECMEDVADSEPPAGALDDDEDTQQKPMKK